MEIKCKFCGSEKVVKRGFRNLKKKRKQVFSCQDCNKRFTLDVSKKRSDIRVILNAVCAYNRGFSLEEACDLIARKYKVIIHPSSVLRWSEEYNLGYLGIREGIINKYGPDLIIGRIFKHSNLIYNFKFHKGKLRAFGKFSGLKQFIFNLSKGIDDTIFNSENRCSEIKNKISIDVNVFENKRLNKAVGNALKVIRNNRARHNIIEQFLLNCDRDTMAVEVPVWYWNKTENKGIHGHIDILQVKNGKIWILDYKPNAANENVDKVVSQLYNYAVGLKFRCKVKMSDIKCGWFDENKLFSFDASRVKVLDE